MDHTVPDVVAESLVAVPRMAGSLAGHGSLARGHPLHCPGVRAGAGWNLLARPRVTGRARLVEGGGHALGRHGTAQQARDEV